MITRWMWATLLMLGATTAWAQPPVATGTNNTPANATAPANTTTSTNTATPATDESAAPGDEEAAAPTNQNTAAAPEQTGPLSATDKIVNRFMALDTNGSEGVSFDEYMAMVQQRAQDRFKSMDANGDGEVTADEYRQFWQSRMAQLYRLKQ